MKNFCSVSVYADDITNLKILNDFKKTLIDKLELSEWDLTDDEQFRHIEAIRELLSDINKQINQTAKRLEGGQSEAS